MGRAMLNSTIVTITAVVLTILLSVLAAYVLSRFEFRFKKLVVVLFTTGPLIPIHSTLVPLFIMMKISAYSTRTVRSFCRIRHLSADRNLPGDGLHVIHS